MQSNDRPKVIMKMSMSVDGRIAPGPDLTMFDPNPLDKLLPEESSMGKRISDAIESEWHPGGDMYGSWTFVRKDDPLVELPAYSGNPKAIHEDFLPVAVTTTTRHWAILVDGRGRYRTGYKGKETPGNHVLHLVSSSAPVDYLAFLQENEIPYLLGGNEHADLVSALSKLKSKLGLQAICLMGGGTLNGVMLRNKLVDEIHLEILPVLFGGLRTPTLVDCSAFTDGTTIPFLELMSTESGQDGYLWIRYKVHEKHLS